MSIAGTFLTSFRDHVHDLCAEQNKKPRHLCQQNATNARFTLFLGKGLVLYRFFHRVKRLTGNELQALECFLEFRVSETFLQRRDVRRCSLFVWLFAWQVVVITSYIEMFS